MTTDESLARFALEYQEYHDISEARRTEQLKVLNALSDFAGMPLAQVTASELQQFVGSLVASGSHVNTVRKKLTMTRSFFGWAWEVGIIDADTYLRLKRIGPPRGATGRGKPRPYKRDEIRELWATLDRRWPHIPESGKGSLALKLWLRGRSSFKKVNGHANRLQFEALIRLALDLGLRRAEILGMSIDDLHYDNAYLLVKGKADPNTGKPQTRSVPFTPEAHAAVKTWLEFRFMLHPTHDRVWLNLWHRPSVGRSYFDPITADTFSSLLSTRIGPKWAWHRLRHTAGTNWLRAGVPLEVVQRILGHASLQQTLGYAEILKTDMALQMERAGDAFEALSGPEREAA